MMILDFSEELKPLTAEETYQVFTNTLQLCSGFSLIFLQCSPGGANRLIPQVQQELPDKKIEVLNLMEPIDNLYRLVESRSDKESLNILFVRGLEKSLKADIKPGYKGIGDYYNLNTVPPILSHLNQQRENFRDHFGNICFVFVLPKFAIRYFVRRAPDFYDWNSGVFEIKDNSLSLFNTIDSNQLERSDHFTSKGWISYVLGENTAAVEAFNHALEINPDNHLTWHYRGMALSAGKRYEEAIASCDKAIEINLNKYEAWFNRGNALINLGRNEEAIKSYDKAIEINPSDYGSWLNRGGALINLGSNEEAIKSYDKAIEIDPDRYEALYNRGVVLTKLGKYKKALTSYNKAVEIKPDDYIMWQSKGLTEFITGNYSAACITWQKTFQLISSIPDTYRYHAVLELLQEFIKELIPRFTQPPIQQTLLIPLLTIYKDANVITELGAALVNTLHLIIAPTISDHTANQWLSLWRTSSLGNEPAMELPLRLMNTAIEYKKDPSKRQRLWLNLPSEERPILDKALKIQ
jgi:tetratricopeptide (TPR) repeat protein